MTTQVKLTKYEKTLILQTLFIRIADCDERIKAYESFLGNKEYQSLNPVPNDMIPGTVEGLLEEKKNLRRDLEKVAVLIRSEHF